MVSMKQIYSYIRLSEHDDFASYDQRLLPARGVPRSLHDLISFVFIGLKPWNEMFYVLSELNPEVDFFPAGKNYTSSKNFKTWDIIGAGALYRCTINNIICYYPSSVKVRHCHRRQGYGLLLYKALLTAAVSHAQRNNTLDWLFCSDYAAGGMSSYSALRLYPSLVRKKYLKQFLKGQDADSNFYLLNKLPTIKNLYIY